MTRTSKNKVSIDYMKQTKLINPCRGRTLSTPKSSVGIVRIFGRKKRRGDAFFQDFKISRFQDFKISRFQDFKISIFQDFKISRFQDFKISRILDFKILRFQDFKISRFQDFTVSRFQDFNISRCQALRALSTLDLPPARRSLRALSTRRCVP